MKMKTVNVSKLKAELSKYLRLVQKGQPILVMDRNNAVAQLVPAAPKDKFSELVERGLILPPKGNAKEIRITPVKIACSKEELLKDFLEQRTDRF